MSGPPYASKIAGLGEVPSPAVDIAPSAVFLVFYLLGAIVHMTIFQINKRRGHKFIMSGMMFGFCNSRMATCVMRIVWATRQHNAAIALASQILVLAGVVILFAVNLIFAQRVLRASHPSIGWNKWVTLFFRLNLAALAILVILQVSVNVQSAYTLNENTKRIDRDLSLFGQTWVAASAFLPIPISIIAFGVPSMRERVDKFGTGKYRSKLVVLITASILLTLGATFRAGTNLKTPRPLNDPAWYQSKACFYLFDFTVEVIVIFLYIGVRVDKRFYVKNGAKSEGDYSARTDADEKEELRAFARIMSEEEVFDLSALRRQDTAVNNLEDIERRLRLDIVLKDQRI